MKSFNLNSLINQNQNGDPTANNPFYNSVFVDLGNYNYLIGGIMFLFLILCIIWYPRAKRHARDYKERQLVEYNKNRPNQRAVTDYKKTKLYLPLREKTKLSAPIVLGVMFFIVGITFFVGKSISTL